MIDQLIWQSDVLDWEKISVDSYKLIYPKVFFNRGSPPKEIFFKEVFDGLTEEEGFKSVLFDEVIRIQDRIDRMEKENGIRIIPYKRSLRISLLFIAIAIFIIIRTIYQS